MIDVRRAARCAACVFVFAACAAPRAPSPAPARPAAEPRADTPPGPPADAASSRIVLCPPGVHTQLEIRTLERPERPVHDGSLGRDQLFARDAHGAELGEVEHAGAPLRCLGYVPARALHLVGQRAQRGIWIVLAELAYITDTGLEREPTAFARDDFFALSSRTSPSGRYVAFVGGRGTNIAGLFVLDTHRDTVERVADPPLPPPRADGFTCDEPFGWGSCWADDYVELEPNILEFEGETRLLVSYGADTPIARARKRRVKWIALAHGAPGD
jgi:hypothetical protein